MQQQYKSFCPHSSIFLQVFALVIFWIGSLIDAASNCTSKQYTIVSPDDGSFIACRDCPPCYIGQGLMVQCGSEIKKGTEIDCKLCIANETYNNDDKPTRKICRPCDTHQNRDILKNCTPTQNRRYGSCSKGFYLSEGTKDCVKCSCCSSENHDEKWVKKCSTDGLPAKLQCKESADFKCSFSTPSTQHGNTKTTSTEDMTKPPVTSHDTKTDANNPETTKDSEDSTPTDAPLVNDQGKAQAVSNGLIPGWAAFAIFIPVAAVASIAVLVWRRRRHHSRTNRSTNDIELQGKLKPRCN